MKEKLAKVHFKGKNKNLNDLNQNPVKSCWI